MDEYQRRRALEREGGQRFVYSDDECKRRWQEYWRTLRERYQAKETLDTLAEN